MLKDSKVIFLDIDGVLNIMRPERDKYGSLFHENFVDNLKRIINGTGAVIVISSTWRLSGLSVMINMWKDRDLPGKVVGITSSLCYKDGNENLVRGDEIQEFIDKFNIINYLILDDDTDMLPHQMNRFVRTSENYDHTDYVDAGYGLTVECADQSIKILNNEH